MIGRKKKVNLNFVVTCLLIVAVVSMASVLFYDVTMAYFKDVRTATATVRFGNVGIQWSNSNNSAVTPTLQLYKDAGFTTGISNNNLSDLVKGKTYYFGNNQLYLRNNGGNNLYMRISVSFSATLSQYPTFTFTGWTYSEGFYYYTNNTNYLVPVSAGVALAIAGNLAVPNFNGAVSGTVTITLTGNGVQAITENVTDFDSLTWSV